MYVIIGNRAYRLVVAVLPNRMSKTFGTSFA